MMWDMGPGWGWWMGFGWLWVIGICLVLMWAVRSLGGRSMGHADRGTADEGTPLAILERRYARGELTDEQYEMMRSRLSQSTESMAGGASAPDSQEPARASAPTARVGSQPTTVRS